METFGRRVIRDHFPQQHREFYHQLPFLFTGHSDSSGQVWASILCGEPGFISTPDEYHIQINTKPLPGDPLAESLSTGLKVGFLGIELATRRRNRFSATLNQKSKAGFELTIDQTFGNCPQYIQSRSIKVRAVQPTIAIERFTYFDEATMALIAQADTFFVASHSGEAVAGQASGADVSHRGGKPGFVRIDDKKTLTIPDYLGNNHFNTLGNFQVNSAAGLLFIDFERGDVISLTGHAEILWQESDIEHFQGAERAWQFKVTRLVRMKGVLPFVFDFDNYASTTEITGTWLAAEAQKQSHKNLHTWQDYRLVKVEQESRNVKAFYLSPVSGVKPTFEAGQFLTLKTDVDGQPQIRTYTLACSPHDEHYRIAIKRETNGVFSNYMHYELAVGDIIECKAPRGGFVIDPLEQRPAILLAGGIGITPILSMARHCILDTTRTRHLRELYVFCSARTPQERSFYDELNQLADRSKGLMKVYWVLSDPQDAQPGLDYQVQGRLNAEVLKAALRLDNYQVFICGPQTYMQSMYDMCLALGINDNNIFAEAFGSGAIARQTEQSNQPAVIDAEQALVTFEKSQVEQEWTPDQGSLLEFAEQHGLAPDFGCRNGSCGSCVVKKKAGSVNYSQQPQCDFDNENEVVLCCARPAASNDSGLVEVTIDC
ncbi:FAD-binding oxidoreductase [Thalassotalea euphylliae]|uniref:FAD-binding oxidoreductase n=2 Tax=Thalassotalea euphylliae TaxID=1655234 RepID=A0A3E0TW77_9GAMM|nr:FAD-binding oxidoreductase [Thalassotalea euphylliae]